MRAAGTVAATTDPATRAKIARIAATPRRRRHWMITVAEDTCQARAHGSRGRMPMGHRNLAVSPRCPVEARSLLRAWERSR